MSCNNIDYQHSRRDFLLQAGGGFGALAYAALSGQPLAAATTDNPVAKKIPNRFGRAKNVIWLFMEGGPSHLDLFDHKPLLNKLAGQTLPESFPRPVTAMGEVNSPILECKRQWKQCGESGLWVSDWLPHHHAIADELCVIHSCVSDGINHAGGVCQMNTGAVFGGRPSLGAWVSYGLGTPTESLPTFVVMKDSSAMVVNGARAWGSGFMPSGHQGVLFETGAEPVRNLNNPAGVTLTEQQGKLAFINSLNRQHYVGRESNSELEARIQSYELAARMQADAPDAVDVDNESEAIKKMYGMDEKETEIYGRQCLLARRLVERGVRFVQLYSGAGSKWDSHSNIESNHSRLCRGVDKPIAGLIADLRQRGMLEDTLVIWGGEFGRTPMSEKGTGRDHNPTGFTMWMAGGGVKAGQTIGATDDLGLYAVEDKLHVHDIHATVMGLLGMDHTKTIYMHKGRPERVDLNEGHYHDDILS
ncbi:DUF1501 domain-containing protein [Blastopirellula sp. JC732]|uniref:DUF1501 domain-containing protein n=1 Tax=Blastopirellula sediminis TaxID=2894196 RepID=A0A9X1SLC1_9BACT|nr:DUF1501 domain-containing protein [Blastopirellula sediminis]MCC9606162.1 DUF1501 domain-containing protein [Blastopirellula sediminis]MCC9630539.1 DUF1501 domain-containing protein [Blastopirellula sediminis]